MAAESVVAIALGSNLGDRDAHLRTACQRLRQWVGQCRVSAFISTPPEDVPDEQPDYLNGALVGFTSLGPRELLGVLLEIERAAGRERPHINAPRTLDLDLILYGDVQLREPGLIVPHPRFRTRRFVLAPLTEIAPDLRDPETGKTVRDLLAALA